MSQNVEIVISFAIGLVLAVAVTRVFTLRAKAPLKVVFNVLAGAILLLGVSFLKLIYLPFNPLTALLIGFLGLPGAICVILLAIFA